MSEYGGVFTLRVFISSDVDCTHYLPFHIRFVWTDPYTMIDLEAIFSNNTIGCENN